MRVWLGILLFIATGCTAAEPVILAGFATRFAVLNESEVIFADQSGNMLVTSIHRPADTRPWVPDWEPAELGWEGPTTLHYLCVSPDGEWVCFGQFLAVPESALGPDESVPYPLAAVVARSDGSDAEIAALAQEVGGGPDFDFSMDSRYLYGQPFLSSGTSLEEYLSWFRREPGSDRMGNFTRIELETGITDGGDIPLSDGYLSCPHSDLVAVDDYLLWAIVDMSTLETIWPQSKGLRPEEPMILGSWISERAVMVHEDERPVILHPDGTMDEMPDIPNLDLEVYAVMPDRRLIYSPDGGESVYAGVVGFHPFTLGERVRLADLSGVLSEWTRVEPMGSHGIVLNDSGLGGLAYVSVPSPAPEGQ